jgi:hypothetical protein
MQHRRFSLLSAALSLLIAGTAAAQSLPSADPNASAPAIRPDRQPDTRPERTVERLRIQDAGSRIDELRVGGETQSISVQPAGNAPAYEVRPANSAGPDSAGARFWNVLKF